MNKKCHDKMQINNCPIDISIIIVNYNTCELTKNCINSILHQSERINFEIILVDNASSDNSVQILQEEFKQINIIACTENLGYGRGNNLGIKIAKGKYIFLLNSDTILLNNALKYFYDFMENHQDIKIGAIGCLLYNYDLSIGRSSSPLPTLSRLLKNSFYGLYSRFILKKPTSFSQQHLPIDQDYMFVGQITGADLFIPKKIIENVGMFDPRFFMYFEETDLQKRMDKEGYSRMIIKGPKIIHLEGQSNISLSKYKMFYKSMFQYILKHYLKI